MTTNLDTVLAGLASAGPDLDLGLGAPAGAPGTNGLGIRSITQPIPGVLRIVDSAGTVYDFQLPQGQPGLPGANGITPTFTKGNVVLQPYGTDPALLVRSTTTPNTFALDFYLPDPAASTAQAQTYAGQAQASASDAAASKSAAAGSATAAAQSKTDAAASVTAAQGKVDAAQGKVDAAAAQAAAAATSATAAATSYDSFDDRYLGARAADPTLDNDGDPLLAGALYFNTTTKKMRVWDGSAWQTAYAQITGGVTSFKGRDGAVTPQAGDYTADQITGLAAFIDVDHFFFAGI